MNDIYKLKYIKYKKKYTELKKIQNNINNIENKIIILPNEYKILSDEIKNKFKVYELNNNLKPISYIKKEYKIKENNSNTINNNKLNNQENFIRLKKIISPDEYFLLSDSNKSKFEINEYDYNKFPNRVVPKNYIKII